MKLSERGWICKMEKKDLNIYIHFINVNMGLIVIRLYYAFVIKWRRLEGERGRNYVWNRIIAYSGY